MISYFRFILEHQHPYLYDYFKYTLNAFLEQFQFKYKIQFNFTLNKRYKK